MGVEKEVLRAGTGPKPVAGQKVTVHCTGFGKNGDLNLKFWSTKDPGQEPFTFEIGKGKVIKGWDEGVLGMQLGEVARLRCSPDYGYGPGGFPAWGIQPNSVLVFEIEVLRAQDIINQVFQLGKVYSEEELVRKIVGSLPKRFYPKIAALELP